MSFLKGSVRSHGGDYGLWYGGGLDHSTCVPSCGVLTINVIVSWQRSTPGWIKVNTDHAVWRGECAGTDGLLRDEDGWWCDGFLGEVMNEAVLRAVYGCLGQPEPTHASLVSFML
ncbi:hypothetical protein Ancab_024348 [Ancistrocladus abbreviatus]